MRQILILGLIAIGFSFNSCTKTNEPTTKSEILQSTTWMVQSVQASGYLTGLIYERGRTPEGSPYDMSKIRVQFLPNGKASAIDNTGNAQTTGTWTLLENDSKISISSSQNYLLDGTGNILSLTTSEFTFSGSRTYKSQLVEATVKMVPAL